MLNICNITFGYGEQPLLRDLSLNIERGEIVALIGPSGCGKTTLFRLIAGLYPLQQGEILLNGLTPLQGRDALSYMMQEDLLLPWRTVLHNVTLMSALQGQKLSCEALELLEEVGLKGCEGQFPHELSVGMRQRVSFARALIQRRPFLIMDEPFASIDSVRKEELYELLGSLHKKKGLTILFITHDKLEAKRLAHRVYELKEGSLHHVG